MSNTFDVNGKFSTDGKKDDESHLPTRFGDDGLPSAANQQWKPRTSPNIALPEPVLRYTVFGRPKWLDYQLQVSELEQTEKIVTGFLNARTEKEHAHIELERALGQRELMPGFLEQDRLRVNTAIAQTQVNFENSLQQIEHHRQNVLALYRERELNTLKYETDLAKLRQELADANALAASAEETGKLKAELEKVKAELELAEANRTLRRTRGRAADDVGVPTEEDDPPELQAALATQKRRSDIARAARKREAAILATVGGDESALDEDALDELDSIRQAQAQAFESVDKSGGFRVIFPNDTSEEK